MPRLRLLWSAPLLMPIRFGERGERADPVRDGTYLGWKYSLGHADPHRRTLVSLDAHTGREDWQSPGFSGREQVAFAGDLAPVRQPQGDEGGWEGAGSIRWTKETGLSGGGEAVAPTTETRHVSRELS